MKKIVLFLTILLSLSLNSCVKLDLVPYSALTPETFFKNEADAKSAVLAAYSSLSNTTVFNQFAETVQSQGTDDAEWGFGRNTNNTNKNDFDRSRYTPESNLIYTVWVGHYAAINICNYAIDNITAMSADKISEKKRAQLIGEAKFLRAYFYFIMVRYFGGVPLVIQQTISLENLKVPRNSEEEVYAQIVSDLVDASANLPTKSEYAAADAGRATKGAALSLLAKVYLTKEEWQKVVDVTSQVMTLGYSLSDKYADNFDLTKENGKESVFEIQYLAGSANPGSIYNGYFRPPFVRINGWVGYGDNPVTKNLWDAYKEGDLRRNVNIRLYTKAEFPSMSATIIYPYYCNKYLDFSAIATINSSGNNQPVIRYSDVLLMRAEALGRLNPSNPEAYEFLNKVRRRAYGFPIDNPASSDIQAGLSAKDFLDTIIKERRLEFAFEGHRWFDLVRTKKLKEAMMSQNPEIGANVEEKHYRFPIPQLEMDANKMLEQNPLWK
jgi:hypothetical protein